MELHMAKTTHRGPPVHNAPPDKDFTPNAPMGAIKTEFARRLQAAMTAKGLNQAELARRASDYLPNNKMIRDSVSKYVRGLVLPGPNVLDAMCKVLGKKPDDLLPSRVGLPSPNSRAADNAPLDVRDLGDGMVWLKINQATDWPKALKILDMLKGAGDDD